MIAVALKFYRLLKFYALRFLDWLGQRNNGLRLVAVGLALWALSATVATYVQTQRIETTRVSADNRVAAAKLDVDKAKEETRKAVNEANNWRTKFEQLSAANAQAIAEATKRQKEAQESDARIIANLKARAEKAEANSVQRLINYDKASAVCKATIDALPVTCKELGPLK